MAARHRHEAGNVTRGNPASDCNCARLLPSARSCASTFAAPSHVHHAPSDVAAVELADWHTAEVVLATHASSAALRSAENVSPDDWHESFSFLTSLTARAPLRPAAPRPAAVPTALAAPPAPPPPPAP